MFGKSEIKVNGKPIFSLIKEFKHHKTQEERIQEVNALLYNDNGILKDDFINLNNAMAMKQSDLFQTGQIGKFYEAINNYILYTPGSVMVSQKAKYISEDRKESLIIDNKKFDSCILVDEEVFNKGGFDSNNLTISRVEYEKESLFDHLINKGYFSNCNEEKLEKMRSIYDEYQITVRQMQQAIDDLRLTEIEYYKVKDEKFYLKQEDEFIATGDKGTILKSKSIEGLRTKIKNLSYKTSLEDLIEQIEGEKLQYVQMKLDEKVAPNKIINSLNKLFKMKHSNSCLKIVYNKKINKKKLNIIMGDLKFDQKEAKRAYLKILRGVGSFDSVVNFNPEIPIILDKFNERLNKKIKKIVKALLRCSYNKEDYKFDKYMDCLYYDFSELINGMEFKNPVHRSLINLLPSKMTNTEIAKTVGIGISSFESSYETISKYIVEHIINKNLDLHYLNEYKGAYKKCKKCGEIKLVHKFYTFDNNEDGLRTNCIKCYQK